MNDPLIKQLRFGRAKRNEPLHIIGYELFNNTKLTYQTQSFDVPYFSMFKMDTNKSINKSIKNFVNYLWWSFIAKRVDIFQG